MKRIFIMLLAAALLVVTGCKKDKNNANGEKTMIFTAHIADDGGKTTIDGTQMNWKAQDLIVINGKDFRADKSGPIATFTGEEIEKVDDKYKAYYPKEVWNEGTPVLPAVQHYTTPLDLSGVSPLYAESEDNNLEFHTICALVKLNLKGNENVKVKRIEVSADKDLSGAFTIDGNNENGFYAKLSVTDANNKGTADVILDCGNDGIALSSEGIPFYVALPAGTYGNLNFYVVVDANGVWKEWTYKNVNKTLAAGTVYNSTPTPDFKEPSSVAVRGLFSISSTEKVYFSQGNLYYDGSNFKLESEQYQFASNWISDHISYFNWAPDVYTATIQKPGTISGTTNDVFFTNNDDDFGVIIGGQEVKGVWHSLSADEWTHLLSNRQMPFGKNRFTKKYNVSIDGSNYDGLFIYPDNYSGSEVGTSDGPATWSAINAAGIVFLPATGYRDADGTSFGVMHRDFINYWSSSLVSVTNAYMAIYANSSSYDYPKYSTKRKFARAVRLVCDAN